MQIADDKKELSDIETKILKMMSESKGNILDDQDLINALAASKKISNAVNVRLQEAEQTVKTIKEVAFFSLFGWFCIFFCVFVIFFLVLFSFFFGVSVV